MASLLHATVRAVAARGRSRSADSHLVDEEGGVLILADGVGRVTGDRAGALAAVAAHRLVRHGLPRESAADLVVRAITVAHRALTSAAAECETSVASTLDIMLVEPDLLTIGHVGDGRVYVQVPTSGARQVTRDHDLATQLHDAGALTSEEARISRWSNVLTMPVGGAHGPRMDVHQVTNTIGTRVLLCTDGLHRTWRAAPDLMGPPEAVLDRLFADVILGDASDDATAILLAPAGRPPPT